MGGSEKSDHLSRELRLAYGDAASGGAQVGAVVKLSGLRRKSLVSRFCVKDAKPLGSLPPAGIFGQM